MMWFLNRARGGGIKGSAPFIGMALGWFIAMVFGNPYVGFAVAVGYILGESFGWGEWVGTLSVHQKDIKREMYTMEEGKNNGIAWLASKVFNPETNWINYCRVALSIRGLYWWLPVLAPLHFVGFSPYCLALAVVILGVGFPIACEIGYRTSKLFSINKPYFQMTGGWEHQEVAYGLIQDLVFIGLGVSYVLAH